MMNQTLLKPGYQTSEMYITLVALFFSILTLFGVGVADANALSSAAAILAMAIVAGFYNHSRGSVKSSYALVERMNSMPTLASDRALAGFSAAIRPNHNPGDPQLPISPDAPPQPKPKPVTPFPLPLVLVI